MGIEPSGFESGAHEVFSSTYFLFVISAEAVIFCFGIIDTHFHEYEVLALIIKYKTIFFSLKSIRK
ncbi:hypothetical protein CSB37_00155, partial [bacterium DOLZORAL124_38_8]